MKEIVKEIKVSTFVAEDGTEFSREVDCKAHEQKLSNEIKKVKMRKIFGNAYTDYVTDWARGSEECWYDVKISSEDDLVDFLSIMEKVDAPFIRDEFIDEVYDVINNGEAYTMLIYSDPEVNYMNRFGGCAITSKEVYERYLEEIGNLRKLADRMEKYLRYEPSEEGEGS